MRDMKSENSVRDSIRAQVERCMYVERVDTQLEDDPDAKCDSFRKRQWKQRRHSQLVSVREMETAKQKQLEAASERAAQEASRTQEQRARALSEQQAAANARALLESQMRGQGEGYAQRKSRNQRGDASVPLEFDAFLDEIEHGGVHVTCSTSPLDAKPFDRLGAISVPCKREGNSLTLCCWRGNNDEVDEEVVGGESEKQQLILFGGRLLRDVTRLLPAAVLKDPMQLERVRYTYSNGVYSYDIESCVWKLQECGGKVPRERSDHSAVFLEPHFVVVVGGRGRNGQIFNDAFVLDLIRWQWTAIDTDVKLIERYWHSSCHCAHDDSIYVFGGKSEVIVHGDLQQLHAFRLRELLLFNESSASTPATPALSSTLQGHKPKLSWISPHTVGKPPSPRFGMTILALDDDRIAVIGGHRVRAKKKKDCSTHALQDRAKLMDFHILDTATMIWSTPRVSSHVATLTTPTERMLFESFYAFGTVIVFGGFAYSTNGATETYTPRGDDRIVYKLDVQRMIWRRQPLSPSPGACWLPAPHIHASSNAVLGTRAFTCSASAEHTLMRLSALDIQPRQSGRKEGPQERGGVHDLDPTQQQGEPHSEQETVEQMQYKA